MDKLKSLREVADYIISSGIEMVNFMYPAADGRLKTLNFTVNDEAAPYYLYRLAPKQFDKP